MGGVKGEGVVMELISGTYDDGLGIEIRGDGVRVGGGDPEAGTGAGDAGGGVGSHVRGQ